MKRDGRVEQRGEGPTTFGDALRLNGYRHIGRIFARAVRSAPARVAASVARSDAVSLAFGGWCRVAGWMGGRADGYPWWR